jgi:hypothetical protein
MPTRPSKKKKWPRDINQVAKAIVDESTSEEQPEAPADDAQAADERNPAAVALGKLGASKGGKVRAKKLSKARRSQIAKKAAKTRWKKK